MSDEAGDSMPDPIDPTGGPASSGHLAHEERDRAWVDRFLVQLGRQRTAPDEVGKALAQHRCARIALTVDSQRRMHSVIRLFMPLKSLARCLQRLTIQ